MDFSVKDFNVRLRTIKLWEILIAIVISFFLTLFVEGYFNISSGELEYILFFCFMMVFFLIATYGTTGFNKDVNDLFKASSILRVLILAIANMFVAIFIQTMFFPLDSLLNMVNSISLPLLDVATGTNDPLLFIFEMFSAIIIAPISEELFFRGVLFNRLKIRTGIIAAMVISSALFAIGHEFGGITSAFVFGICMCIIYLKTDNILMTMSIHFLNNLVAVILEAVNADAFLFQMPVAPITGIVSVIAGLLIIVYIFEEIKRLRT